MAVSFQKQAVIEKQQSSAELQAAVQLFAVAPPASKAKGKASAKAAAAANEAQLTTAQKVDRIAVLQDELAPWQPKIDEFDVLKKALGTIARGDEFPADQPVVLEGEFHNATWTRETHAQKCTDMHGLIGALKSVLASPGDPTGYAALLTIINIPQTEVAKYLSPAEMAKFYTHEGVKGVRKFQGVTGK